VSRAEVVEGIKLESFNEGEVGKDMTEVWDTFCCMGRVYAGKVLVLGTGIRLTSLG
jgi:hypothetical protein